MLPALSHPAALADTQGASQDDIAALRRTIEEQQRTIEALMKRVTALESAGGAPKQGAETPPDEIPTEQPPITPSGSGAAFMPDFAVIGNHRGTFLVPRGYEGRNRFELSEFEIALQQPIYTGMTFYANLAGGSDAGFGIGVEEAYVSMLRPFNGPFDAFVGKRRIPFGKVNTLHPHAWHYVDQPAPIGAFLGEEGMFGNGASLNYTLPVRGLFANLDIGLWRSDQDHAGDQPAPGSGIVGDMPTARLWLSRELSAGSELEIGGSQAFGKGENGDTIGISGADLTFRSYPSTFSRLQLQAEAFWHTRKHRANETESHTRSGHFALLSYAPDQYNEFGLRYDNTRYPWPIDGREQSLSLIYSNRLTEATIMRLQLKFGDRTTDVYLPARKGYTEVFLQFIWGAGSHKHPLQ
jgi:hypothetical protein